MHFVSPFTMRQNTHTHTHTHKFSLLFAIPPFAHIDNTSLTKKSKRLKGTYSLKVSIKHLIGKEGGNSVEREREREIKKER